MPLRFVGNNCLRRIHAPNVNGELPTKIDICLHYGGDMVRTVVGFEYQRGSEIMLCSLQTNEFTLNHILMWIYSNVYPSQLQYWYVAKHPRKNLNEEFSLARLLTTDDLHNMFRTCHNQTVLHVYVLDNPDIPRVALRN